MGAQSSESAEDARMGVVEPVRSARLCEVDTSRSAGATVVTATEATVMGPLEKLARW